MQSVLKWLQRFVALIVVILLLQGRGSHAVFVAAISLLPLLRLGFGSVYRREWKGRLAGYWQDAADFHARPSTARIPWKAAAFFAALPMVWFSLVDGINISSLDNQATTLVSVSLAYEGNTELSEFSYAGVPDGQKICPSHHPGPTAYYIFCMAKGAFAAYPLGMVALQLPMTIASRVLGGDIRSTHAQWRLAKFTSALIAGISLALFFVLALFLGPPAPVLAITAAVGLGSTMLGVVGHGLWTQSGVMLGALAVLVLEALRVRSPLDSGKTEAFQGLLIAWMLACRLTAGALIYPFGIYLLYKRGWRGLRVPLYAFLFAVPLAAYNFSTYDGGFLGPQYVMASTETLRLRAETFLGILFSPACGLFVYQSWLLLLALWAWPRIAKPSSQDLSRTQKWGAACLAIATVSHLLVFCTWKDWWSGIYGTRHLTEIVPLLALFLVPLVSTLWPRRLFRIVFGLAAGLAIVLQVFGVYARAGRYFADPRTDPYHHPENKFSWSNPPFLYPFRY